MAVQSQKVFSASYRLNTIMLALLAILLGGGLILVPGKLFALLAWLLPLLCVMIGIVLWAVPALKQDRRRKSPLLIRLLPGLIFVAGGVLLWFFNAWQSTVLWSLFIVYLLYSSYQTLRPVWARGVEKQIFWRYLGTLTTWGFTLLLFMKPRSELSTALLALGCFAVAWGFFQLLLPPPEE